MLLGRDIGNKKVIKYMYMTFYGKSNVLIEIVAFLLRLLLAVKILSFDERILLLNKEHSRSKNNGL